MVRLLDNVRRLALRRIGGSAALGGGLLLVAATVAVASIPDSNGVIHGCYNTSNGNLRVIDSANDNCRNSETAIFWNQTGPQGPAGPQGPPGSSQGLVAYSVVLATCGSGSATHLNNFGGISGTFNAPVIVPGGTGCLGSVGFKLFLTWDFQNLGGPGGPLAVGSGTAVCDPCTVAGRTGTVNFALTVLGLASVDASGVPDGAQQLGGSWTIVGATGNLAGLTGQGTYTDQPPIVFTGTVTLPT
jgi:hypothetical protein